MPFEGRAIKKLSFNVVLPVSLAAGISLVLMVKHLTHGSPRSTELIPPGTVLVIRLNQRLTSRTAHIGDRFKARLAVVKGAASVHSGLWVEGECLAARKALPGRRAGYLRIALSKLRDRRGHTLPLQTTTLSQWGNQVLDFDTSLGAALKTGSQGPGLYLTPATGSQEAVIRPEAQLSFVLIEPLVATGHREHL